MCPCSLGLNANTQMPGNFTVLLPVALLPVEWSVPSQSSRWLTTLMLIGIKWYSPISGSSSRQIQPGAKKHIYLIQSKSCLDQDIGMSLKTVPTFLVLSNNANAFSSCLI